MSDNVKNLLDEAIAASIVTAVLKYKAGKLTASELYAEVHKNCE